MTRSFAGKKAEKLHLAGITQKVIFLAGITLDPQPLFLFKKKEKKKLVQWTSLQRTKPVIANLLGVTWLQRSAKRVVAQHQAPCVSDSSSQKIAWTFWHAFRSPRVHFHVVGMLGFLSSDINQPSLSTPFDSALGVCFCLYGPFNCISFLKFFFSPDVISSGWLGSKHQLTCFPSGLRIVRNWKNIEIGRETNWLT